ncbi:hypothetical protein HXX76_010139 [Chlamydomonas incerta]|uniref:Uncharacterized protein n=1 Tax=Chlamydomonas incerta TaxID=51695 RepID=A0A835SRR6_CHLIN|nr:hypothetical protein HXX76_010139 [Chlamydomonas incerta]|eukprot:KAG2430621.1 hypothetical protein HXX76_010139 [Chlamydomonas incerta]
MVVKTCQADDALEKQFEGWLKQQGGPEVGILVGKYAAGAKVILYGTIKTPSQEGLDPILVDSAAGGAAAAGGAGKGGKKPARAAATAAGSVAVTLEYEWIAEHARQVSRMLPGGLSVLGLYLFASEPAAAAASPQLASVLAGMGAFCLPAALSSSSSSSTADAAPTELLLLHVDSGSRKQGLRAIPAAPGTAGAGAPSGFHPCELKYAPALGSLVCVRCWHGVDARLTVGGAAAATAGAADGKGKGAGAAAAAAAAAGMRQQLAALLAAEAERVRCGVFITGDGSSSGGAGQGTIPAESAAVGDALAACAAGAGRGVDAIPTYDLTLLAPLPSALPPPPSAASASAGEEGAQLPAAPAAQVVAGVCGQARLSGCLQGVAFVSKRDNVGRALAELKADLVTSLGARVDLLVEEALRSAEAAAEAEAEAAQGEAAAAAARHPLLCSAAELGREGGCEVALPRRVLLPWLGGGLALSDYLLEGEPAEAAAERAAELLALQGATVLEAEQPAAAAPAGPWHPTSVPGTRVAGGSGGSTGAAAAPGKAGNSAGSGSGSGGSSLPCSAAALVSMAVAALAGAVGLMSMSGQAAGGGQ